MESVVKTIFKKIIDGELPADKVYEDEEVIVIKDKFPKAPVHLLIIPKKVIESLQSIQQEDLDLIPKVIVVAQKMAKEFNLEEEGYRLLVNHGSNAGQTIFHLHFHMLGGMPLGPMG
jgi:histidine triad (HIT) family protein